jgi:hypothetical protein
MKKFIVSLSVVSLLFTACKKEDDAPAQARVMVTHASPNAPGVDLLIDDNKVNTAALTFPNSTGYLNVTAGTRNVKVNAAGTTTSVINANVNFEANKNYSVFACNTLTAIEAVVLEDNLATPAAGKAHIRVVHLSPDAPTVNVGVAGSTANVFTNLSFKQSTAFTPVDAGSYTFEVRVASNNAVAISIPATLAAGKIYTIFARGFLNPPTGNTNTLGATIINNN